MTKGKDENEKIAINIYSFLRPVIVILIFTHLGFIATSTFILIKHTQFISKINTIFGADMVIKDFVIADNNNKMPEEYKNWEKMHMQRLVKGYIIEVDDKKPIDAIVIGSNGFILRETLHKIEKQIIHKKQIKISILLTNSQKWVTISAKQQEIVKDIPFITVLLAGVIIPLVMTIGLAYLYFVMYRKNVLTSLINTLKNSSKEKKPTETIDDEVAKLKNQINEMFSEKTLMLTSLAHDINTPLLKLRLRADNIDKEDVKQSILKEIDFIQNVVRSSFTIAKGANIELKRQTYDITSSLKKLQDTYYKSNNNINFHLPDEMFFIQGDPVLIQRAIINFIENSLKFAKNIDIY